MGIYFNPPPKLADVGRRLDDHDPVQIRDFTYEELVAQLSPDEALFGYYRRNDLPFDNAPWLMDQEEFDEFERMNSDGTITRLGFYALTKDDGMPHVGFASVWDARGKRQ